MHISTAHCTKFSTDKPRQFIYEIVLALNVDFNLCFDFLFKKFCARRL